VVGEASYVLSTYGIYLSWRAFLELVFYLVAGILTLFFGRRFWTTTTTTTTTTTPVAPGGQEEIPGNYTFTEYTQTTLKAREIDGLFSELETHQLLLKELQDEARSKIEELREARHQVSGYQHLLGQKDQEIRQKDQKIREFQARAPMVEVETVRGGRDGATPAQVGFMRGLSRRRGIPIPEEAFRSRTAASNWLDRHADGRSRD
jgi:hypothetical protein